MSYFWISEKKTFGRNIKFGDEVKDLDKLRADELVGKGLVSESKPETITSAEKNKISEVGLLNESLIEEISALKEELEKTGTAKLKEARGKIAELEAQLDEATKPKGK